MAITTIFFLLFVNIIWCAALYLEPTHTTPFNYLYNISYGLSFLMSGIVSLRLAKTIPQNKYLYNQVFISTSLFFLAQFTWAYYNVMLHSEAPYPSVADFFWIIFYIFNLFIAAGIFKSLKIDFNFSKFMEIFAIFAVIFTISHTFVTANSIPETSTLSAKILDIAYPLFDSLLVSIYLSSIRSAEGRFKPALLYFTSAFFVLTIGDSLFTYQNILETYWNGNFVDGLFAISGYLYAMGVISLPLILSSVNVSDSISSQDI